MKNSLYLLFFIAVSHKATAQITYIPDPAFELQLIYANIDSDGIINGQVLTSDVESVTSLFIDSDISVVSDLTGIQDFTSLEIFFIYFYSDITELDISQNTQLKILGVSQSLLVELNLSNNILLEELYCGNPTDDVWPQNEISYIDLSNNPNIHTVFAENMSSLKWINFKNGNNNPNMTIDVSITYYGMWDDPNYDPNAIFNTVCIEVDDENLAQSNQYPYSEWDILDNHVAVHFTDNAVQCSLSTPTFAQNKISIYPNPVSDILYFETAGVTIEKVMVFDLSGRKILEQNQVNNLQVSDLQKGNYILKIVSAKGIQTEKIIVK
ncbi:MAG: T9SS type A sorting domain-containing protein [Flavobacteriaceae bacterium]